MKRYDLSPADGLFGPFGGQYIPDAVKPVFDDIDATYRQLKDSPAFRAELHRFRRDYIGRPSPVYHARALSKRYGADIYLKREDLNHTGAHKINHCIGEVLLAKHMGKKKVLAETGAGQHGVALATAAAVLGMPCDIYMGTVDIAKQAPNVLRMKMLGARVVPVEQGARTLKEAVDAALDAYMQDPQNLFFAIGSVVGPHPFPSIVRDFQRIVGEEAREQIVGQAGRLPDSLVACVGGGSNAIGLFSAFLEDEHIALYGVEPGGRGTGVGEHAATLRYGSPGVIHGMFTYLLQDKKGEPAPVHSIASGLDYPGVGPQHSFLHDAKRLRCATITDAECIDAFHELSRVEGIIPALESAHAVAFCKTLAEREPGSVILANLSGRGDKDIDYVQEHHPRA
ncbi:MAG: tryptophan synthase subunit beta [Candidatus Peribacteraceae bacterium]|nr:tryptophan synthase subunit beta [Candidatus Peribacteraceae bacterium]